MSDIILTTAEVDAHLDAVLRASGSSLKNYSMHSTKEAMRAAIRDVENAVLKLLIDETDTPMTELWDPEHQCPGHTQDTLVAYGIAMYAKGLAARNREDSNNER